MKKYLLLMLLPIFAYANIGEITVLRGDVTITRDSKVIKAKSGSTLEKSDFIKTANNAKVQIVFSDKTIFTIGKNSTLDIADYLYDEKKPSKNKAKFNVLKGAFTSITGRIGKLNKSKFKLKTKSASIGIRGTIVKANQETIMCTEGAITVTTPNGISININAGSKTSVASGVPSAPETIKAGDEAGLGADITEEDKEVSKQEEKKEKEKSKKAKTQAKAKKEAKTEETTQAEVVQEDVQTVVEQETTTNVQNEDITSNAIDSAIEEESSATTTKSGYSMKSGTASDAFEGDISNQGSTGTSDGEDLTVLNSGDATSWGYWNDNSGGVDKKQVWVGGTKTSIGVINALRNDPSTTTTYNYSGQVIGSVKTNEDGSYDDIKVDNSNAVNMQFDLGGGQNNFSGDIGFQTDSGKTWSSSWTSGTTTSNSFSTDSVSGTGEGRAISSGSVDGSFYGTNAEDVGGTFQLNTDQKTASGVFKATK